MVHTTKVDFSKTFPLVLVQDQINEKGGHCFIEAPFSILRHCAARKERCTFSSYSVFGWQTFTLTVWVTSKLSRVLALIKSNKEVRA